MTHANSRSAERAGARSAVQTIAVAAVMSIVAACTGQPASSSATGAPSPAASSTGASEAPSGSTAPSAAPVRFDGQTIIVGSLSEGVTETFKEGLGKAFEEKTGGKIEWVAGNNQAQIQQLVASRGSTPPYDVVLMDSFNQARAAALDLIEKPNFDNVPNATDLPESAYRISGYGAGTWYFLLGLCYNTEQFASASAGLSEPAGLETLKDSAFAGRIGFPDSILDLAANWQLGMPGIADALGNDVANPDPTIEWLYEMPDVELFTSSTNLDTAMTNGDIWLAFASDGRCNGLKKQGVPVEFSSLNMEIDGKTYDYIAASTGPEIIKGTTKTAMAEALINAWFTPEAVLPFATKYAYTPTLPAAVTEVQKNPDVAPYLVPDAEGLYAPDYATFLPQLDAWVDSWNRKFRR